jgi:hypothetical protein
MSIPFGDILKHNNLLYPIVDIDDVKGGLRSIATFSNTDLYNAFNDIPAKLKQNYSTLLITSSNEYYYLSDTDPTITTSWTPLVGGGSTGDTLQEVLDLGNTTTTDIILQENVKVKYSDGKKYFDVSPTYARIVAYEGVGSFPDTESRIQVESNGNTLLQADEQLYLNANIMSITGKDSTFKGAEYVTDYSANFTDRSLVDKAYVDANSVAGSGLTNSIAKWVGTSTLGTGNITDDGTLIGVNSLLFIGTNSVYNNGSGGISTNTAFGKDSLISNTTGYNNTAIGYQSLYSNTVGYYNTVFGVQSLYSNTTGNFNTAIGHQSLFSSVSSYNTAIGHYSLHSNTTGYVNTAIGSNTLQLNTTGNINIAIGQESLYSNTVGYNNTSVGVYSLYSNISGHSNTAIGHQSLYSNTNGDANTAIGYQSLYSNTTEVTGLTIINPGSGYTTSSTFSNVQLNYLSGSTAVSYPIITVYVGLGGTVDSVILETGGSGFKDTTTIMTADLGTGVTFSVGVSSIVTGYQNTAVGNYSLYSNTTGSVNIAIGNYSLYLNTTGLQNTAIGNYSLYLNTTGLQNTAIGFQSLCYNTTGVHNTAIGYQSLFYNTTGYQNTAIGYQSLYSNTTGGSNITIGYASLYSNISGNNNTAIGEETLYYNTTGLQNTVIGSGAGMFSHIEGIGVTNSNTSVFIGAITRPQSDNQTNQIVIGYGATGYGSNTITLGNNSIIKTYLKGSVQLPTVPTTSTGTYSILTRNDITGEVEKILPTYKVYTALLTRTGATGPSAIILENTIGPITYSYDSTGVYSVNSSSLFTLDKTVVFLQQKPDGSFANCLGAASISSTLVTIVQSTNMGTNDDDWVYPVSIEIRVYN